LSETVDVKAIEKMVERLSAIAEKAHYEEETERYWIDAEDWRELRNLLASSLQRVQAQTGGEAAGHSFGESGKCSGCGMTDSYYEGALAILEGWPEDSEKEERIAELRTCRKDLKRGQK